MNNESANNPTTFHGSCTFNDEPRSVLRGYIDGTITGTGGMPNNPSEEELIVYREKPAFRARKKQIAINLLGLEGGRPYVDARLSRFAGENKIDWIGGQRSDGSCSTGRLQQTHYFPYLGRIAAKKNQYVFQKRPEREGADEDVLHDITRDGKSIDDVMRQASDFAFAGKWCWIGVDAPARKDDGSQYTLAEKEAQKIRPYWQVYSPLDVADWKFDTRGELLWIKTQRIEYNDTDPRKKAVPKRIVSLWEKGKVTEYTILEKRDRRFSGGRRVSVETEEIILTDDKGQLMTKVPFVLVGQISSKPIAFDDLESISRTIMDLGSVDRANIFNAVYAQLVLPASLISRMVNDSYATTADDAAAMVIGQKYPITLEKDDPQPSYLMPDASSLKVIPERIDGLKRDLFEVVGLALEQSSRQVASAESKAWDFMDVSAVMKASAQMLQDAESKAVALSVAWDSNFKAWEPRYNTDFDVGNFKDEIQAIVMAGNMPLPSKVSQMLVKKLIDRADRIGSPLTADERKDLMESVDSWNPDDFQTDLALPAP